MASTATAFPDGTTDHKPLRSKSKTETAKVHIADTPMTWSNLYKHIDWLNTTFIIIVPLLGFISAYWVPLQLYTAIFSVIYYFSTGLGITAGKALELLGLCEQHCYLLGIVCIGWFC
jgi:stearoyl-CoA desaturase (delta-9 desaturase)